MGDDQIRPAVKILFWIESKGSHESKSVSPKLSDSHTNFGEHIEPAYFRPARPSCWSSVGRSVIIIDSSKFVQCTAPVTWKTLVISFCKSCSPSQLWHFWLLWLKQWQAAQIVDVLFDYTFIVDGANLIKKIIWWN